MTRNLNPALICAVYQEIKPRWFSARRVSTVDRKNNSQIENKNDNKWGKINSQKENLCR